MVAYRKPGPIGLEGPTRMMDGRQVRRGFIPGPIGSDCLQKIHTPIDPVTASDRIEKIERELECSTSDINTAKRNGMVAWDVVALRDYCISEQILLVIRSANPKSRDYRYRKGFAAKPSEAGGESQKIKTGSRGVLLRRDIERHTDFGGTWKHAYHEQSEGFYSDYDIMCVWRRNVGRFELIPESEIGNFDRPGPLLDDLNAACGWMFKHGANDHWLFPDGTRRNPPKMSDSYVAFDHNGRVHEFPNPIALSTFYKEQQLKVPYID